MDDNDDWGDADWRGDNSFPYPNAGDNFNGNQRNNRYRNAYDNYNGGYGPSGGYGPPQFGPPQLGPPEMGPPRMFGPSRQFLRRSDIANSAANYLHRCGIDIGSVKAMPKDLLQLIEPTLCRLCGQSFDSFASSRIHYISRNHMKNQQKWFKQKAEGGVSRALKVPLKSRDLYCELCDVEITSKMHADSHYAGRAHRAIVEGRKQAKNPILLRPRMSYRLRQLIVREKKHLKELIQTEKEVKTPNPELTCDICKTSVTCSEQMTMHLNGKKHLSKEKQHILQLMTGKIAEEPPQESTYVEQGNQDEEQTIPENKEGENAEDDFGWGNDGGSWEDTI